MSVKDTNSYVEGDRAQEILLALTEGKSREEIVQRYHYSSWRSADMYMRRKGYVWDNRVQNYTQPGYSMETAPSPSQASAKVSWVISLFEASELDPRAVAKRVGFKDHRELADYMKNKGYIWSGDQGNYVELAGEVWEEQKSVKSSPDQKQAPAESVDLKSFIPILQMLDRNKERLIAVLMPESESGTIPHYAVPGVTRTKSIYMSDVLSSLAGQFCERRNLTQKQVYETALVEFLKRYGFRHEVEALFKKI